MNKHDKLLAKMNARPPACDIRWVELKSLLESLGYEELRGSGSRRKFYNKYLDDLIVCHEPHPRSEIDRACIADVAEHLRTHGLI